MRRSIYGYILFSMLMLTYSPVKAERCLSDEEIFQHFGLSVTQAGSGTLTGRVRTSKQTHTLTIPRHEISSQEVSGNIVKLRVTGLDGAEGTPHKTIWIAFPEDVPNVEGPEFGTHTQAQVFVALEGQPDIFGLVLLDKGKKCVESNRAMFETLLLALQNGWRVKLGLIKARLLQVKLQGSGQLIGNMDLGGRIISSVSVQHLIPPIPVYVPGPDIKLPDTPRPGRPSSLPPIE